MPRLFAVAMCVVAFGCGKKPVDRGSNESTSTIDRKASPAGDKTIVLSTPAQIGDMFDHPERYKGKQIQMNLYANLLDNILGQLKGREKPVQFRTDANYDAPQHLLYILIPGDLDIPNAAKEFDKLTVVFEFAGLDRNAFSKAVSIVRAP
jgi:hypothetical protein